MKIFLEIILVLSVYMVLHNFLFIAYIKFAEIIHTRKTYKDIRNKTDKVSIIIPAFNEQNHIINKMDNIKECLCNIDFQYEVLIGSDGSTDNTNDIVSKYILEHGLLNWKLFEFENNGKGQTINKLVSEAAGDIVISTDTDILIDTNAVKKIFDTFQCDEDLGCVSCIPVFRGSNMSLQSLYWNFEMKIRDIESMLGDLIVVTGWLYAFKRSLFTEIPEKVMADDLWIPLTILLKGYKSIHIKSLKGYSEKTDETSEVKRRKRVIAGGIDVVIRLYKSIIKNPMLFFIVFSHKINRWLLPLWISLIIISTVCLTPVVVFAYIILLLFLIVLLKPKKFFYLLYSVLSPVFTIKDILGDKDLSKWDHTRIR